MMACLSYFISTDNPRSLKNALLFKMPRFKAREETRKRTKPHLTSNSHTTEKSSIDGSGTDNS